MTNKDKIIEDSEKKNSLSNFIILDIETIGLYKETGKIIEIAALKVENWKIVEEYDQLINPQCKIPRIITDLTSIRDKDVTDQPIIDDILEDFLKFIGKLPLVGHNIISFDKPFIEYNLQQLEIDDQLKNDCLDTMELAIFLKPEFKRHKLEYLYEKLFNKRIKQKHRAIDDCKMLFDVLLKFREVRDKEWNKTWLNHVGGKAKNEKWAWADFILEGETMGLGKKIDTYLPVENFIEEKINPRKKKINNEEEEEEGETTSDTINIDLGSIKHYFDQDTAYLKKVLPKGIYEYREQQKDMAIKIADSINKNEHLVVEAPTGCGKSLAYLIPCLIWSLKNNNEPIVISTHTNVLQDQLFENDFLMLKSVFSTAKITVVKGREHYVCLRKLRKYFNEFAADSLPIEEVSNFSQKLFSIFLANWVIKNKDNNCDIDRFPFWLKKKIDGFRNELICSDKNSCQKRFCPFYKKCFVNRMISSAWQSNIIITNHSLVFSEPWNSPFPILPKNYKILVFDEAINIESAATDASTRTFSLNEFKNLLLNFSNEQHKNKGFLEIITLFLKKGDNKTLLKRCNKIVLNVSKLMEENIFLFNILEEETGFELKYSKREEITQNFLNDIKTILGNIKYNLKEIESFLNSIYEKYNPQTQTRDVFFYKIKLYSSMFMDYIDFIDLLNEPNRDKYIFYKETPVNLNDFSLNICYKNVGEYLEKELYVRDFKSLIFTSAALTYDNNFSFISRILGLNKLPQERLNYLKLGNYFDYNKQCILFLIKDLPRKNYKNIEENTQKYYPLTADFLKKIVIANNGSSLILFTNREDVEKFSNLLIDSLENNNIPLISSVETNDPRIFSGSLSVITEKFRNNIESCLIGTRGLRGGVDIPGKSLEMVILVKMPFENSSDPILQNRKDIYGGFDGYILPLCIFELKQAFGRLIRSKNDNGFVFLIDEKLERYTTNIVTNLPEGLNVYTLNKKGYNNFFREIKNTKDKGDRIGEILDKIL